MKLRRTSKNCVLAAVPVHARFVHCGGHARALPLAARAVGNSVRLSLMLSLRRSIAIIPVRD